MSAEPVDAALWYAARGWPVLRVEPGGKKPVDTAWQRRATTDPDTIRRWWTVEPRTNVGLLCGVAFDVLDIEAAAIAALAAWLEARGDTLPEGPLAWTGRGGFHAYYRPSGQRKANLKLDGLRLGEHRTAGHQVLAPPSVTEMAYRWAVLPTEPLPKLPAWVGGLREGGAAASERPVQNVTNLPVDAGLWKLDALARRVARSPEGERSDILFWAARKAAKEGHPLDVAEDVLHRAALAVGLGDHAATATIRSGFAWADR